MSVVSRPQELRTRSRARTRFNPREMLATMLNIELFHE